MSRVTAFAVLLVAGTLTDAATRSSSSRSSETTCSVNFDSCPRTQTSTEFPQFSPQFSFLVLSSSILWSSSSDPYLSSDVTVL